MSCPTCDHTMVHQRVEGVFWCPRCGTLIAPSHIVDRQIVSVPVLVERCREFHGLMMTIGHDVGLAEINNGNWKACGIAESINLPGDRPQ